MLSGSVLKRCWPAVLWMTLIFVGSTDLLSSGHTSGFLGPFFRWLVPAISDVTVDRLQFVIRKCGHATEYGILASLVWMALNAGSSGTVRPWPQRLAVWSWIWTTLYAASDEWHQSFVPTRQGQVSDVVIDSLGALLGLFLVWAMGKIRRRWLADDAAAPAELQMNPR